MILARYTKNNGKFDVELMVLSQGHTYKFAEFTCEDEKELKENTEHADYVFERGDQ